MLALGDFGPGPRGLRPACDLEACARARGDFRFANACRSATSRPGGPGAARSPERLDLGRADRSASTRAGRDAGAVDGCRNDGTSIQPWKQHLPLLAAAPPASVEFSRPLEKCSQRKHRDPRRHFMLSPAFVALFPK